MLQSSPVPLSGAHDVAALDLDGVVYVGKHAVPGAVDHLAAASAAGMRLAFVTNNASRPPSVVGDHLRELGIDAADEDVVTSAQAAASLLLESFGSGSRIFLIGGEGLDQALRQRGLDPVASPDDEPVAVVQGYGPDVPWRRVIQGAILVNGGMPWVATNTDMTIPTATGVGPGNGTLVKLIADFTERSPVVAGKPEAPLLRETQARVGGDRPIFVGDRLDTDILGANGVGWPSLLVRTGVTGLRELVAAPVDQRPTYVSAGLEGLLCAHEAPVLQEGGVVLGGWRGDPGAARLTVTGSGAVDDWWRVAAVTAWTYADGAGAVVDVRGVTPPQERGPVR